MALETATGIAGGQLLSMLVAWGKGKHDDKKRRERVHDIFHAAFTQLDNRDPRVGILCDKSSAFRNEMFSLAKGNYQGITRMAEEAKKYWEQSGDQNFSPSKINEALYEFGSLLCNQSKEHGDTTVGDLAISFDAFAHDARHLRFSGRSSQAEPAEPKQAPPPFYVPHEFNELLHDYAGYVEEIAKALADNGQATVDQAKASFVGQGGLGKTAMAIDYAYRHREHYPGGVFWLQAEKELASALADIAPHLGWTPPEDANEQTIINTVTGLLAQQGPILLVVDNLEDPGILKHLSLPQAHLLITTRRKNMGGKRISLDLPAEKDALQIFLGYADLSLDSLGEGEIEAAKKIVERVGNLPVALEIMGKNACTQSLVDLAAALEQQVVSYRSHLEAKGETATIAAPRKSCCTWPTSIPRSWALSCWRWSCPKVQKKHGQCSLKPRPCCPPWPSFRWCNPSRAAATPCTVWCRKRQGWGTRSRRRVSGWLMS